MISTTGMVALQMNCDFDRAVGEHLLDCGMSLFARFQFGPFHGVSLKKLMEMPLVSPAAAIVIEVQLRLVDIANDRIAPVGKLYLPAGGGYRKQHGGPEDRHRQVQSVAGEFNGRWIADLGFDRNNLTSSNSSRYW